MPCTRTQHLDVPFLGNFWTCNYLDRAVINRVEKWVSENLESLYILLYANIVCTDTGQSSQNIYFLGGQSVLNICAD